MSTRSYRPGIPAEILALSHERDLLRRRGNYARADELKARIEKAGYVVKDNPHGAHLVVLPSVEVDDTTYRTVRELPSYLAEPDLCTFSVVLVARNNQDELRRCLESVLRFVGEHALELLLVDNASKDTMDLWIGAQRYRDDRIHVLRVTRMMSLAEARNIALQQSRGRYILLLDSNVELTGDIFTPLAHTLAQQEVGITGGSGLRTEDLRHFEESDELAVEAITGPCLAFRRELLQKAGLFDERYRLPHYMDIDFSFALRDLGSEAQVTPDLLMLTHPVADDALLSDAERTRLNKRNFYRFLEKWGDREDLLLDKEAD